jgi:hypothetical protein
MGLSHCWFPHILHIGKFAIKRTTGWLGTPHREQEFTGRTSRHHQDAFASFNISLMVR